MKFWAFLTWKQGLIFQYFSLQSPHTPIVSQMYGVEKTFTRSKSISECKVWTQLFLKKSKSFASKKRKEIMKSNHFYPVLKHWEESFPAPWWKFIPLKVWKRHVQGPIALAKVDENSFEVLHRQKIFSLLGKIIQVRKKYFLMFYTENLYCLSF